jgi:transposase-like protein
MSEAYAARLLREVRWSNGVRCIYCDSLSVICWGWYRHVYRRYRCKRCLRTFNDKSGTDFEYSRIPLNDRRYWRVSRVVEVDEVYVNAGLKGRGNHGRIIFLGRGPRCRGLRAGRGMGGWDKDVIPVFTIIGRNGYEVYIPSRDVSGETVARIASRHIEKGSRIYTDSFPSYSILQGMGTGMSM